MTVFCIGDSESDIDQEQEDANLIKENKSQVSLDVSKDSKDGEKGHHDEPILKAIEKICCLIIWPMQFIMPVKVLPELALLLIFFRLRYVRVHPDRIQCFLSLHRPQPFLDWTYTYGVGFR